MKCKRERSTKEFGDPKHRLATVLNSGCTIELLMDIFKIIILGTHSGSMKLGLMIETTDI